MEFPPTKIGCDGPSTRRAIRAVFSSVFAASRSSSIGATLDDLREAVTTLDETVRTARRVFGGAHPIARAIEIALRTARAALRARETPPPGALAEEVD